MEIFDIEKYKGRYVMHTATKEQYDEFCAYLDSIGKHWMTGKSPVEEYNYDVYKEDTCINFNNSNNCIAFSYVSIYKASKHTILEMEDFTMPKKPFTKANLKTGDFVKRRDGSIRMALVEAGVLIGANGTDYLEHYNNDLTRENVRCYDIMTVHRPVNKCDYTFSFRITQCGTLVYERKEIEEMTLAEICKALGKEIKIVKG